MSTVGSGDQADLQIPDPGLAAIHARLDLRQGIWALTVLASGAAALVDGEPVEGETPLSPGSTIQLADTVLLFEPRDQTEAERARRAGQSVVGEPLPAPGSPPRSGVGFFLAVALGVLLFLGGIALELLA